MRRFGITGLLLLSMAWQALMLAGAWQAVAPVSGLPHVTLHWQGDEHHHEGDGSYHLDDSAESVQHLIADHTSTPVGLLHSPPAPFAPVASGHCDTCSEEPGPHPFLDGPLKPPRRAA